MKGSQSISFKNGLQFSNLLGRKSLFHWIREFLEKSDLPGSYWEFGVFQGESVKEAYYILREQAAYYLGFDSFRGLPALEGIDRQGLKMMPGCSRGNFKATSEKFVRQNILSTGMPKERLLLFPGFFRDSLTVTRSRQLLAERKKLPVIIHLDVDLYESTKQALDFVFPFLRTGCWILFDDYWCYRGASRYGNQRAIREFLIEHKNILLQPYSNYQGWSRAFIVEKLDEK